MERTYIAIDLKSFYASVECVERGLNPMTVNLVVADPTRTEKTICLAVSPSLKAYGISGRARLFEVVERVKQVNGERRDRAPGRRLTGSSTDDTALRADPTLAVDYLVAPPRMRHYMEVSTQIYQIYLNYVAPEDIHVYSVDEVFMDVTGYLKLHGMTPHDLAMHMVRDVLRATGITATAGIGTNLYLCKVAMDIVAKHVPADKDGVRIAELDEESYRRLLWTHQPITDFWRVGRGYARRLASIGLYTMGDVARCSLGKPGEYHCEDLLYQTFGINAELLIDHAWGWEPCTIADIKAYKPSSNSLSVGQVLQRPYTAAEGRIIVQEMTDGLVMDLISKGLATDQMVLTVGYDRESLEDQDRRAAYRGPVTTDGYGRRIPKHGHGSMNLGGYTASGRRIGEAMCTLYDRVVDDNLLIRRMYVVANHVREHQEAQAEFEQLDLFAQTPEIDPETEAAERRLQEAVLHIKNKYGKNALLKGTSYRESATARERNGQIGGHRA